MLSSAQPASHSTFTFWSLSDVLLFSLSSVFEMSHGSTEAESTSGSEVSEMSEGRLQHVVEDGLVFNHTHRPAKPYPYVSEAEKNPDVGRGAVIIWDFDTASFKAEHAEPVVSTLLRLCRDKVPRYIRHKPTILFCYTRKIRDLDYPGREQAITEVRRRIPPHLAYVRTRTTEQKEGMEAYEARQELRAVIRFNIREFQNRSVPGPLMVIVSGDGDSVAWHMKMKVTAAWETLFVIPHELLPFVWRATRQPTSSYTWDFHKGIVGENPKWGLAIGNGSFLLPPPLYFSPDSWLTRGYQPTVFYIEEPWLEPVLWIPQPPVEQVSQKSSFVSYPYHFLEYQPASSQPVHWTHAPSPSMMVMPAVPGFGQSSPMMVPTQGFSQSPPMVWASSPPCPHWYEQPYQASLPSGDSSQQAPASWFGQSHQAPVLHHGGPAK
ncbi:hypothetical protein RvY_00097 [Ramazzottius varieornatus]|uniref:Uncharacterized protein n=1 Tax=Ramazzottius varieornatus TaxID=947166 RepID=A0A1D1UBI8_RAMVA|nr:hypothetical protein RvY_00097 [Ramazzottius varieornatus]